MKCDRLVEPRRGFQAIRPGRKATRRLQYMHNQRQSGRLAGTSGAVVETKSRPIHHNPLLEGSDDVDL
jgi:hypothetical protein